MITLSPTSISAEGEDTEQINYDAIFELNSDTSKWDHIKWNNETHDNLDVDQEGSDSVIIPANTQFNFLVKDAYAKDKDNFTSKIKLVFRITNGSKDDQTVEYEFKKDSPTQQVYTNYKLQVDTSIAYQITHDYTTDPNCYTTTITLLVTLLPAVTGVTINSSKEDGILWVNDTEETKESLNLTASVTESGSIYKKIEWSSDNEDATTLSTYREDFTKATVTAKKAGTSTITAKVTDYNNNEYTSTYTVTVKDRFSGVSISSSSSENKLYMNGYDFEKTMTLTAVLDPNDVEYTELEWTNSKEDVVSMTTDGLTANISLIKLGTSEISVRLKDKYGNVRKASYTVSVRNHPIKASYTIEEGQSFKLETEYSNLIAQWGSVDTSIATVVSDGVNVHYPIKSATITGVSPGTVLISHKATTLFSTTYSYYQITVTESTTPIKQDTEMYVLDSAIDNPEEIASDSERWIDLGKSVVDVRGFSSETYNTNNKVTTWPTKVTNGTLNTSNDAWKTISAKFINQAKASGIELTASDISSIVLQPYKIVKDGESSKIYCKPVINSSLASTANFFLQDIGQTGARQIGQSIVVKTGEKISQPSGVVDSKDSSEGVTNTFDGWYSNCAFDGNKTTVGTNYTLSSSQNFYGKYDEQVRTVVVNCFYKGKKIYTTTYETTDKTHVVTAPSVELYACDSTKNTQTVETVAGGTVTVDFNDYYFGVTLTGNSLTCTYDGEEHEVYGYNTLSGSLQFSQIDKELQTVKGTEPGTYENVMNEKYVGMIDDSNSYIITKVSDGKLVIKPSDEIVVNATGADKEYDGKPLKGTIECNKTEGTTLYYATYDQTSKKWSSYVKEEPSITDAGTLKVRVLAVNELYPTLLPSEYTLTIRPKPITVTITGTNKEIEYDGQYHAVGYTVSAKDSDGNVVDYTESEITYSPGSDKQKVISKKDVGTYTTTYQTSEFINYNQNYDVTFNCVNEGGLKITRKTVTLTSADKSCVYNGQACEDKTVQVEGLVDGEGVSTNVTGTQTKVGTSKNTFDYTVNSNTDPNNYEFTKSEGTLTVEPKDITITANNMSKLVGDTDPKLTVTVSGLVDSNVEQDKEDWVLGNIKVYRDKGETVGTYTIHTTDLSLSPRPKVMNNYRYNFVSGTFTITNKTDMIVTPTLGNYVSKTYDGTSLDCAATSNIDGAKITYSTKNSDGTWSEYSDTVPTMKDVGSLTIKAKAEKEGYETAYTEEYRRVVTVKDISVTANDSSKTYLESDPEFTAKVEGIVEGDTINYTVERDPGDDSGTYEIKVSGDPLQGNYSISYHSGTFTINPNPDEIRITLTGSREEYTYNGLEQTSLGYTAAYSKPNTNITIKLDPSAVAKVSGTNVGTYYMNLNEASFIVEHKNYSNVVLTVNDGYVKINPADGLDISSNLKDDKASKVYDDTPLTTTATSATKGTTIYYSTDGENWSLEAPSITDVGTCNVTAKAVNPNYEDAYITYTLEVTKRPLVLAGNCASVGYTGQEQSVSGYNDYGMLVEGHTLNNVEAIAKGTAVGLYIGSITSPKDIVVKSGDRDVTSNYEITTAYGLLNIGSTSIEEATVTEPETVTYDGNEHKFIPEVTLNGQTLTEGTDYRLSYSTSDFTNVGDITVTIYGKNGYYGEITKTYKIEPIDQEINLVITGNHETVTYDGSLHRVSGYTVSGIENTDITVSYNESYEPNVSGVTVNTYNMGLDERSFTIDHKNYSNVKVTVEDGSLTITPKGIVPTQIGGMAVDVVNDVTYNGKSQKQSVTVYDSKLNYFLKEGIDYTLEYSKDTTNAGVVVVDIIGKGNYGEETEVQYNILQKQVTVKADDLTVKYGETPTFTATETGTLNDDKLTYSFTREEGNNVGTYVITPTGEADQGNYLVTFETGTLTIEPTSFVVDDMNSVEYTGQSIQQSPVVKDTNGNVLKENDDYTLSYSDNTTDVGTVTVSVIGKGNYTGTIKKTYEITPKKVTVKAVDVHMTYGDNEPEYSAEVTGTVNDDKVAYSFTRKEGNDVGTYTITPVGDSVQGNYSVTFEAGTLTIDPATLIVKTDSAEKVYDGSPLTASGTYSGLKNDETITFNVIGSQKYVGESQNTYRIIWSGSAKKSNYVVSEELGTLKVTEASTPVGGEISKGSTSDHAPKGEILNDTQELGDMLLDEKEKELVARGYQASLILEVVGESTDGFDEQYHDDINSVKNNLKDYTLGKIYSIDLLKVINEDKTYITKTDSPIQIKMNLEDSLVNRDQSISREYKIIRVHTNEDGSKLVEDVPVTLNGDQSITFNTDKFSIYAIVYKDTKKEDSSDNKAISCEETKGKNWTWSESKNACVYKVSNTKVDE